MMQKKKKVVLILLTVAVALFLAGSLARCAVNTTSPAATSQLEETEGDERSEERAEANSASASDANAPQYNQKEQELLDYLAASKWADPTGKIVIEFTNDAFVERSTEGGERRSEFRLESLEAKPNETTAVVETEGKYVALSLVLPVEGDAIVSSQAFSLSPEYKRVGNVRCKVEGLNEEALNLIDDRNGALGEALAEFCESALPTATVITFAGSATVDTKAGTVTLFFEPNTIKGVSVQVVYDRSSNSFTCSMSSGAKL